MNIMPNECEKDCDKDSSNGTTAKQAKQTHLSGLVTNSVDFLKSPSLLISSSIGEPARSHSALYSVFWVFHTSEKKTLSSTCGQVYEE